NTITFNALSDGSYSDCRIRVADAAGNLSNLLSISAFAIDSVGATLTETTPITTPTADSTPSYSFSSSEVGSITYSGSCSSSTSVAVSGTNTITFNALSDGSYSDCRIRVTDAAGNLSNLLSVSAFEIDSAGATLTETTPVITPSADSTPSYSFSSTEAGSIAYSGSCSSSTSNAVSGTSTITFNALSDGSYSDCGITVTDVAGNMSNLLLVSSFEVDRLLLSLETHLPSTLLQDEHLLVTQSVIGGKAPFEFRGDNLPEWLVLDPGTGQIKGTPGATDINTYSDIVFHITDSEERAAKSVAFELRVIDVNDAPIAEDDVFTLVEGGKRAINVLANDSDPDEGDLITIEGVSSVLGDVTIVGDMLEYEAPIDFVGDDIISYIIVDSGGLTATAEVVVSITYDPELGLPPTLVLPDDVVVDATGLLTKVALGFATATDSLNNTISVSKSSDSYFQPGAHQVVWTAEDSRGRTTSASQSVWVHPLISIGSDTQVEEGGAVSIGVYLNGDSPIYPVVIDYTLSGSADENDHDLTSDSITFAKGRLGRINFSTLSDDVIEGDETLDIQLSDTVNIGGKFTHSLIITEKPFAPDIRLKPFQAGMERYSILDTEGLVTIYMYLDTGSEDDFSYTWDASKEVVNLSNETSQFIFDPELVSTGNLVVNLDLRTAAGLSTAASVNLLITSEALQPSQTIDCSVINEQESDGFLFMVEAEPQTCIMRGELALKSRSGGIQILEDELITLMETSQTIAGGVFDFVVFGKPEASTYQIVFPQRKPIPEEAVYLKFSTQLHEWFDFVITAEDQLFSTHSDQGRCPEPNDARWVEGLTAGDWCLKLIIKDGGPNDVDGIANGMVVDPSGLASLSGPIVSDNHDPVAKDDFYQLINAEQIELDVLDNDSDSDGDQLVVIEASADLGFADIVDGVIWYHPASVDFFGTDVITYVISDDMGGVDKAVASLDVIIGNSLPVAVNDTLTMLANSQSSIDVLSNDSDPDGDPLSLHKASTDSGQVEVRGDRLIVTPDKAFVGEIHISYFVIDPSGAMATAKVTVTVKEGEKVSVENNSGGVMSLSLFLLLLIFTQRYLFITSVNERSHY
ncbi:Ig-like domain-containing protein, partial [Shewanella hanedai]|uniref:Ig-like domain-containing protein n=1 Tax=Shewanella hanedai TaxID=25 RepID=UPI0016649D32